MFTPIFVFYMFLYLKNSTSIWVNFFFAISSIVLSSLRSQIQDKSLDARDISVCNDERVKWCYRLQVLRLLQHLVKFGYYMDMEDVKQLLTPLLSLLDGTHDVPFPKDKGKGNDINYQINLLKNLSMINFQFVKIKLHLQCLSYN